MRYLVRKYANNRGSALFMVISTMTALMISCMAMYFSVISSRSTQYAIFNQQQSKQVGASVNESLLMAMRQHSDGMDKLVADMQELEVGEAISAGSNGFATFGLAGGAEDDEDLGAYTMEILRLPDETVDGTNKMVYDFITKSSVNGTNNVQHLIFYLEQGSSEVSPMDPQIFAATGLVPNDVFMESGKLNHDMTFDNEITYIRAYSSSYTEFGGNVYAAGHMQVENNLHTSQTKALEFVVGLNYTNNINSPVMFAPSPCEKSTVLIGGDAKILGGGGVGFGNANVYIGGDMYLKGTLDSSANYYVNGNVYVMGGNWPSMKHVYSNGVVDVTNNNGCGVNDMSGIVMWTNPPVMQAKTTQSWNDVAGKDGVLSVGDVSDMIKEKTQTQTYLKWVINDSDPSKDKYVRELDEKRGTAVKRTLHFDKDSSNPIPVVELKYSDSEKGCIIEDVTANQGNGSIVDLTVLIDTGLDEDNIYTIRVKPNRDCDGDNVNETFSWYPFEETSSNTRMNIIVKGRGSVVIDIPKGVTYQDSDRQKFMHYGWYVLGGGVESNGVYNQAKITGDFAQKFIHKCTEGDECIYTESQSSNKCNSCSERLTSVECSVHQRLYDYCKTCQPDKNKDHTGECDAHIDRKGIDEYLASRPDLKSRMMGSDGELIYPNTNIFLVSCDESADIRLSIRKNVIGDSLMENAFFGYIYAPYMTFKSWGNGAGGGLVRLCGGLTVSDYVINENMSLVACWPDKPIGDLMSKDFAEALPGVATKDWKVSLKAY